MSELQFLIEEHLESHLLGLAVPSWLKFFDNPVLTLVFGVAPAFDTLAGLWNFLTWYSDSESPWLATYIFELLTGFTVLYTWAKMNFLGGLQNSYFVYVYLGYFLLQYINLRLAMYAQSE